jgi:hypothetical protein
LRWDARRDEKSKHGKFDNLWFDSFKVVKVLDNKTFVLHNLDDIAIFGGRVNGCFLKHFLLERLKEGPSCTIASVLNFRDAWLRDTGRDTWLADINKGKKRKVGESY